MNSLTTLVQALGVAYASGLSPYATVALAGIADRMGWIDSLPGALGGVSHPVVIVLASVLMVMEFLATLVPGLASVWETVHTAIRPPAASALAVLTAWNGDPALIVAAALLGGGLGLVTHTTKLGVRYTIDTSPEPVTNGAANVAELGVVAAIAYGVWNHPYITLTVAIALLVLLILAVRSIWRSARRALRSVFRSKDHPAPG
jgi:heme exporter protein D